MPDEKSDGPQGQKFLSNDQTDLISCDKNYYFDLFCGEAKKESGGKASLEVWIDTSSSLRAIDSGTNPSECARKSFVKRLQGQCKQQNFDVFTYDTSIKLMGGLDTLCLNYGLNDTKRLIDWIKGSSAKRLIIITDISEMSSEFTDYLESIQASYQGDRPDKPLRAAQLVDMVSSLKGFCQ